MTRLLEISVLYLNEVENSKLPSPSQEFLERVLDLLEIEVEKYFDLVGLSKNGLPNDVFRYLFKNNSVLNLVRTIRNFSLSDDKINELKDLVASQNFEAIVVAEGSSVQLHKIENGTPD